MIYSKIIQKLNSAHLMRNGGGGIRTHGALADTLVFKTRALNHSTTPPTGYSVVSEPLIYIIRS